METIVNNMPLIATVVSIIVLGLAIWRTSTSSQRHMMQLIDKSQSETRRLFEKSQTETRRLFEKSQAETRQLIGEVETRLTANIVEVEARLDKRLTAVEGEVRDISARMSFLDGVAHGRGTAAGEAPAAA